MDLKSIYIYLVLRHFTSYVSLLQHLNAARLYPEDSRFTDDSRATAVSVCAVVKFIDFKRLVQTWGVGKGVCGEVMFLIWCIYFPHKAMRAVRVSLVVQQGLSCSTRCEELSSLILTLSTWGQTFKIRLSATMQREPDFKIHAAWKTTAGGIIWATQRLFGLFI